MSFLRLPQELQDRIFRDLYEGVSFVVQWNPDLDSLRGCRLSFDPLPTLSLELVCRAVSAHAKAVRDACWPRTLTIVQPDGYDEKCAGLGVVFDCLVQDAERYFWVCNRIEEVIALNVAGTYISYESCFTWQNLLRSMPRLRHFSFHTSYDYTIKSKNEARKFLSSLETGQHDHFTLGHIHGLGIGDLPEELQLSGRPNWSVLVLTTACFTSSRGAKWYRRITKFDFRPMAAISFETIIDNLELRLERTEKEEGIK